MLKTGDKCPPFLLNDQHGNSVNSAQLIGHQILVIFFYPKDETRGCTVEACTFRDEHETFMDEGAKVIGISSDSIASHDRFAQKFRLPYTLLADEKKEVRKAFQVPGNLFGLIPGRVTYIVDKSGVIRGIYNSLTDPRGHIQKALECVRSLKS